jgi:hypothetical protein
MRCSCHKMHKTRIEQAQGRRNICDSGYYRLYTSGDPSCDSLHVIKKDIARLVSRIHSASITNGNRLGTDYIGCSAYNRNHPQRLDKPVLHANHLPRGHLVNTRFCLADKTVEVDYATIQETEDGLHVSLYEVKDGGELDTKKGMSEVQSLVGVRDMICQQAQAHAGGCRVYVELYIVLWNTEAITRHSFKSPLGDVRLITGRQMCQQVGGMDFDTICLDRMGTGPENLVYTIRQFRHIVHMYDRITKNELF